MSCRSFVILFCRYKEGYILSLPLFLQDRRFLQALDKLKIKEEFIKITVLNWKEQPIEQIQGIVINGNVNLDGSSSMRRTANLTIFAEEKDNNLTNVDHLFSVNKKCKVELGIVNTVPNYTFQTKDNITNVTNFITINYKQKYGQIVWFPLGLYVMFNPSISHSLEGVQISMQLKDKMCLLNGDLGGQIHSSVQFSYQDQLVDMDAISVEKNPVLIYNIIKQLVNHWGNEQLSKIIISEVPLQIKRAVQWTGKETLYANPVAGSPFNITLSTSPNPEGAAATPFQQYYDTGFVYDDFTYPGDLTCNAGETVTNVLDKIINVIGNYEYFYDVEGNFIFREKQNYLNMTNTAYWIKQQQNKTANLPTQVYEADNYRLSKSVYNFTHNKYTTAYNNSLNYNNLKNDFVVWGLHSTTSNSSEKIPCRFHLAIDKKPRQPYEEHKIALFEDSSKTIRAIGVPSDSSIAIGDQMEINNKVATIIDVIDNRIAIDWREQIYYQMLESEKLGTDENTQLNNTYFQYYAELKEEFPKIYDLQNQKWKDIILQHPDKISYYLDFIDEDSELGQYSVSNIGRRAKIVDGSDQINCVFEPDIPDIVYINSEGMSQEEYEQLIHNLTTYGQRWTQIPSTIDSLFTTGGILNSCFEKIKDLLYQYTHFNNTISITTLPIYYLEPNTRITVEDQAAGIYGDYIIQSISLPLDISSTMTINAYRAEQKI